MGDLQTVGIGHGKAWRQAWLWGGSLLRGVASGVGISFAAWLWGGSLVGGAGGWPHRCWWLYRSEKRKKKKKKFSVEKKREQREHKENEKKKEKVSDEIRGEREKVRMKYQ